MFRNIVVPLQHVQVRQPRVLPQVSRLPIVLREVAQVLVLVRRVQILLQRVQVLRAAQPLQVLIILRLAVRQLRVLRAVGDSVTIIKKTFIDG